MHRAVISSFIIRCMVTKEEHITNRDVACVAADSFPFSGRAEIEQANEKRASEGARLG